MTHVGSVYNFLIAYAHQIHNDSDEKNITNAAGGRWKTLPALLQFQLHFYFGSIVLVGRYTHNDKMYFF